MDVGQAHVAAIEVVSQPLVVEAHLVQDGRVEIENADRLLHHLEAEVIALPDDLAAWNALPTEKQEKIVGRTKLNDVELDDKVKPSYAHNALTRIVENGKEVRILRDNMPFGQAGQKEFGTYFIGYCRSPKTIEEMLQNMFVGKPPGNYDRLLDFSRAVTGNLFFVPSATFLENVGAG